MPELRFIDSAAICVEHSEHFVREREQFADTDACSGTISDRSRIQNRNSLSVVWNDIEKAKSTGAGLRSLSKM